MVNVTRVTYLDPNKLSGVTNGWSRSRNMVAFGKNKTVEGEFLCALLRVTKGLVVVTRLGATWKAGLATVCQESGYLNLPGGSCGREASVCSPAVPEGLSPGLGSCATVIRGVLYKAGWLLSADMFDLSSWEKKKEVKPLTVMLS